MEFKTETIDLAYEATRRSQFTLSAIPGLREGDTDHMKNAFDLEVVIEAINQEANGGKKWVPDFTDSSMKYENLYYIRKDDEDPTGFVLSHTLTFYAYTRTYVGSRLCFFNRAAALFFFEQFKELIKKTLF